MDSLLFISVHVSKTLSGFTPDDTSIYQLQTRGSTSQLMTLSFVELPFVTYVNNR